MNYFESDGLKATYLEFALLLINDGCYHKRRSRQGLFRCGLPDKVDSRSAEETINSLTFLRSYFQNSISLFIMFNFL